MDLEIVTIPADTALAVFTTDGAIDPYLNKVSSLVESFKGSVATPKGRQEIKSFAARIGKFKAYVEKVGLDVAREQKLIPKKIDATRSYAWDKLEAWQEQVRQPLTEWEDAEKARIEKHESTVANIAFMAQAIESRSSEELRGCLATVEEVEVGPHCEEYAEAYAAEKAKSIALLTAAIAAREKYEAEQVELAKLRQEAAERAARDREETIRREAAKKARADAERMAKAETDRIEAQARADREAAERAAQKEKADADRREADLKSQAEAAERRAAETEARIKREAEEALAAESAATAKREADKKHRAAINGAALDALVANGITEETAKLVVTLIAKKAIPAITISY